MPTAQPRNDDLELERREEVTNEWSSPPPRLPPTGRMTPVPSTLPLVSHDVVPNVTHHSHSIIRLIATLIIVAVLALFLFETLFEKKDGGCVHHCDLETTMPPTTAGTPSTETPSATALTPVTSTPAQTKVTSRPSVVGRSGRAPFIDTSYWYFPSIYGTPSVALDSWAADASSSLAMHGPGVSTDADIASHGRSLAEVLPCAAQSRDAKTAYRYPIVFAPVGCFGDPLDGRKCDEVQSTSCKLGVVLAKVVEGCSGAIRVGSLLGDNFYPSGLRKTKDQPRFDHELTQKFWRHESLQMQWLIAVGNHDGRPETQRRVRVGSPLHAELLRAEAEVANASAVEAALATKRPHAPYHPYAHMPDFHHVSEVFTAGGTSVQFFIVNTMWGFAANDGHMPDEAEWLDSALRDSTAKWKIVLSHEPIWGFMNFVHGKGLAQNIHPILVRHGVQFYVCAHQHSVSMHRAPGGYYQVISAGFADNLHDAVKPRRPTGFYHVGRGAVSMLFNASHAVVVAYTDSKKLIFAHAVALAEVNAAMAGKAAKQNGVKVTVPSAAELLASGRAAQTTRLAKAAAVAQKGPASMTIPLDWELEGEVTWAKGGPKSIWDPSLTKCDGFLPAKAAGC